jgi:hypothetical protein
MDPVLNDLDLHSATTQKVKTFLEDRLQQLRKMNDAQQSTDLTAHLRGRIAETKRLYNLMTTGSCKLPSDLNVDEATAASTVTAA